VVPSPPQQADGQVAKGGHHLRAVALADLAVVLIEGHVADPVQAVFDLPLAACQPAKARRAGAVGVQAGDA
jgi:hypothetical protein